MTESAAQQYWDRQFAAERDRGELLCSCPGDRTDDECPSCRRPRLSAKRITYLRARGGC